MKDFEFLTKTNLSIKDSLVYQKNVWTSHLTARVIDWQTAEEEKTEDPERQMYFEQENRFVPAREIVEYRKLRVQDALRILRAIDKIMATENDKFESTYLSDDALKVSPEMVEDKVEEKPQDDTKAEENKEDDTLAAGHAVENETQAENAELQKPNQE